MMFSSVDYLTLPTYLKRSLLFFLFGLLLFACRPQKTMSSSSAGNDGNTGFSRFRGTIEVEYNPNYAEVFQRATKKQRPIFISFYSDWCETCPYLNEKVIEKQPVVGFLEENCVSYIIDAERSDGYKLATEYKIAAYPTILLLNSEGTEISRYVGLMNEHKILQLGKNAVLEEEKFQKLKERK